MEGKKIYSINRGTLPWQICIHLRARGEGNPCKNALKDLICCESAQIRHHNSAKKNTTSQKSNKLTLNVVNGVHGKLDGVHTLVW
jgi:hypothetical protein